MGGGLIQLVAYGAQDAYLSGNPQITFWRGLYKRHTNFAMEPIRINMVNQPSWSAKQSILIPRHADLAFNTYLEVILNAGSYNNDQGRLGYNLLKYVELDIGGQVIDRLYSEWMFLWDSLFHTYDQSLNTWKMVGAGLDAGPVTITSSATCTTVSGRPTMPTILYIPLPFWFTRNPGAALPLIALQYHEVKLNIVWNDAKAVSANFNEPAPPAPLHAYLLIDYIYLGPDERRRMAQESHEYLIEQTQFNEDSDISVYNKRVDLTFNHPIKELVWTVQPCYYTDCTLASKKSGPITRLTPFTYDRNAVYEQAIQFNGQDRVVKKYGDYFSKVQIYQHHSGGIGSSGGCQAQGAVYVYSFAIRPEEHQPSGTCNFSRVDTATLVLDMDGDHVISALTDDVWRLHVYAVNYNILRVVNGMAGVAFVN